VEDSARTNILFDYQGSSWRLRTDTYLLRRRRQLDDPESAVPSDSEIATFVLVATGKEEEWETFDRNVF
jgi:hypothetical protein